MSRFEKGGGSLDPEEREEWLSALRDVLRDPKSGKARAAELLADLNREYARRGGSSAAGLSTPYLNTIPLSEEPRYPGDYALERRIKSIIRWNAMAMVMRANRREPGIGGHIATYASAATLCEVGFNHFFRARTEDFIGDLVFFQGHASPGIYARAFLEGRLSAPQLENFRAELDAGGGLPSYPHPRLMPDFWQFPTVSMGLGPLMGIYNARFMRYLKNRGALDPRDARVWVFVGDGECDEPESLGALSLAAREGLDNLIFVVNCNLQRLDGPVRGNGKIIQELESVFRGAGWNVIKVIWGGDWDPLLARDRNGLLAARMESAVDGDYQRYAADTGAHIRSHFFGQSPELLDLVKDLSDATLLRLSRGGHDSRKVYAAYWQAVEKANGRPTVILAKTIKGYGLGAAGEAQNIAHAQKKLDLDQLRRFRDRFSLPIADRDLESLPFYKPPEDSPEMRYLLERRKTLGGFVPRRVVSAARPCPHPSIEEFFTGSGERQVSTTMAFVRFLSFLLRDKDWGPKVVPIVADEARTFGMEALFRQVGIYSPIDPRYEPLDRHSLTPYIESRRGQLLEEGINEAGAMASFIAAGTSAANFSLPLIPFYIFYSMFGFQRVGDLIWAAADARARGFLLGATAGRTTLSGEGLQHQDGHSLLWASAVPYVEIYDPATAYELAVILQDGLRRMGNGGEDIFYYLTMYNEAILQPAIPTHQDREALCDGILKGMYCFAPADPHAKARVHLLASGSILFEALAAKKMLEAEGIGAALWSVTSWNALRREAMAAEAEGRDSFIRKSFRAEATPLFIAASDWVRLVPDGLAPFLPGRLVSLGTDGFGRSAGRTALRRYFGVDALYIAGAARKALADRRRK